MIKLVQNEMMKLMAKKKLLVIAAIIGVLVVLFTYAQFKQIETQREKLGTTDWKSLLQQQIIDTQNRLSSSRINDEWKKQLQVSLQQQQYYLDNNINPSEPGAPTFMRMFIENASDLFLPLMVMVIAADLVSSEHSLGSIKLLLTRPVKRWKVLLSKYMTLCLAISAVIAITGILSYVISGAIFGYRGWSAPILSGFKVTASGLDTSSVRLVEQWQFLWMEFGLVWFVAIVVGTLSFMLSVLIRSTAAGMGIMLAALISGAILSNMVSSWTSAKYFFMVNLKLTDYMNGKAPPIEGMTLSFSLMVLLVWWAAALFVSFFVFTKKDVY
ncbi:MULTISPECIES: ABC transporter permease [unclassified Bacillus (in: firmicutes)]|uniref:ABC transporter permease n=1 Tax=unclassified Bacillus (in: firmicutes) TaxID=185979 RepID=UPI0008F34714|nr:MULTISPECIES: ABC transporter permease [unclassified Bacillus (in: firmicutes)]SFA71722.1 ABC-2 type transport system permease protein [Bacillus sp. UNCCL13]SFQ61955.1 ABC-2 type transport system permease protein [Bacillus sp. cl95]